MFLNYEKHPDFKPPVESGRPAVQAQRVTIGPIPPRDDKGRLRIKPIPSTRIKTNKLGEPIRDDKGQPIEEEYDARDWREYFAYQPGHEREMADGATRGLKLFQVDLVSEPLALVYARDEQHAVHVYKKEMGITRFGTDAEPRVTLER